MFFVFRFHEWLLDRKGSRNYGVELAKTTPNILFHREQLTLEFGFEFEFELDFELKFELDFELDFELKFELEFYLELRF